MSDAAVEDVLKQIEQLSDDEAARLLAEDDRS